MPHGCVIFDFDGVLAHTEDLHLAAYNAALAELAPQIGRPLKLTPAIYFSRYVVFGDEEAFTRMLRDAGAASSPKLVADLCRHKNKIMDHGLGDVAAPPAGVRALVEHLRRRAVRLAICSSARGKEINDTLRHFNLREHFQTIVAIEDVRHGKPDPEGYTLAFERLAADDAAITKAASLGIEDTRGGAMAARGTGLRVLGVATTSPLETVRSWADYAVADLSQLDLAQVDQWLGFA